MAISISEAQHREIEASINRAENRTSVEFFAVVAERSDDYRYAAGFFMVLWMLVLSLFVVLAGRYYWFEVPVLLLVTAQLACLISGFFLIRAFPDHAIRLVPRRIRYLRSHANAVKQFLAHGIHATSSRNGLLIFVSKAEQYVEILADTGIDAIIDQSAWNEAVTDLSEHARQDNLCKGFTSTIDKLAERLEQHFPLKSNKKEELDDKLVLL